MGRIAKDVPFFNNAGGLNEAISSYQMNDDECQDCQNVYFNKYGKFGSIHKRKGLLKKNSTPVDSDIIALSKYELYGNKYMNVFTDAGTLYSTTSAMSTCTSLVTGLPTTRPTFDTVNNIHYAYFPTSPTDISLCETTTNWAASGAGTTLSLSSTTKFQGTSAVKVQVAVTTAKSTISTCDATTGWSNIGPVDYPVTEDATITLDNTTFAEGTGSIKLTKAGTRVDCGAVRTYTGSVVNRQIMFYFKLASGAVPNWIQLSLASAIVGAYKISNWHLTKDVNGNSLFDGNWHLCSVDIDNLPPSWTNGGNPCNYASVTAIALEGIYENDTDTGVINFDYLHISPNPAGANYTATKDLTGKTVEYALGLQKTVYSTNRARSSNVATITTSSAHGLTAGDQVLVGSFGSASYNVTSSVTVLSVPTATTFTYNNPGLDESVPDTAGVVYLIAQSLSKVASWRLRAYTNSNWTSWTGTTDAGGNSLTTLPAWNLIRVPINLSTKELDDGTGCTLSNITKLQFEVEFTDATTFVMYIDQVRYYTTTAGLYYTKDNVTWTAATGQYLPIDGLYIKSFDGRLFVASKDTIYWSNVGAGFDFYPYSSTQDRDGDGSIDVDKSASSTPVSPSDGDIITGLGVIGKQLIIFKTKGLYRLYPTGSTSPIYRIDPQLSGKGGEGVGCASHWAIQNCVLENLYSDVYGKAEYLIFPSIKGIHALGITGNPLDIHDRIRNTFLGVTEANWAYSFAVVEPRNNLYILTVPASATIVSSTQLVFCLKSKSWSKYALPNITSAIQFDTSVVFGDSSGTMLQHEWRTSKNKLDYVDDTAAINAYWKSKNIEFGNPGNYNQILSTMIRVSAFDTTQTISQTIATDTGETETTSINIYSNQNMKPSYPTGTASTAIETEATTPSRLYAQGVSYKFANAVANESMDILGWMTTVIPTRNRKGA